MRIGYIEVIPGYEVRPENAAEYRAEWLNLNLGGLHWLHNHLIDVNLKAEHSCSLCRIFRDRQWPRSRFQASE